jgi:hypothetical protein
LSDFVNHPTGESLMNLVVYLETSRGPNPGHIVIGEESRPGEGRYFGYRFNPLDLPEEFRPPVRWRDYLFDHTVPGGIVEDALFVDLLLASGDGGYVKRARDVEGLLELLPPPERWARIARYSFNPDDHTTDAAPCYNCVTWATMLANRLVAGFLSPVRQGRVKLIVLQLVPLPG